MSLILAPEGSISNVTSVINSNTSITLSWLPVDPNLWNGIITSYIVEYQRQEPVESIGDSKEEYITLAATIPALPEHPLANSPDPRLVTLPLREESLHLEELEENYVYQVSIYSENSAGRSEASRPKRIEMPPSGINLDRCYVISYSVF